MIKTREEKGIVRPDMINLLLEARRGDQKHDEAIHVETGFATVEEADLGKGKLPKYLKKEHKISKFSLIAYSYNI